MALSFLSACRAVRVLVPALLQGGGFPSKGKHGRSYGPGAGSARLSRLFALAPPPFAQLPATSWTWPTRLAGRSSSRLLCLRVFSICYAQYLCCSSGNGASHSKSNMRHALMSVHSREAKPRMPSLYSVLLPHAGLPMRAFGRLTRLSFPLFAMQRHGRVDDNVPMHKSTSATPTPCEQRRQAWRALSVRRGETRRCTAGLTCTASQFINQHCLMAVISKPVQQRGILPMQTGDQISTSIPIRLDTVDPVACLPACLPACASMA